MANYEGFTRTCYFHVIDEATFRAVMATVVADSDISIWERTDDAGNKLFAFGTYGSIDGIRPNNASTPDSNNEADYSLFVKALQKCLLDGDVIIITEVGHEKMRYFNADAYIISKTKWKYIDFHDLIVGEAGALEPNWPEGIPLDY